MCVLRKANRLAAVVSALFAQKDPEKAARIAEAHRGRIWAESSGGINTFYFTIPI